MANFNFILMLNIKIVLFHFAVAIVSALFINNSLYAQSPIIQWQNTIGGNSNDYLARVLQTSDGGYILGGNSQSNISGDKTENCIGGEDMWIVKIDNLGNLQWQNTIGGSHFDQFGSFAQTNDGGYILGGTSRSDSSGDKTENSYGVDDYWVVKIDSSGEIQWDKTMTVCF